VVAGFASPAPLVWVGGAVVVPGDDVVVVGGFRDTLRGDGCPRCAPVTREQEKDLMESWAETPPHKYLAFPEDGVNNPSINTA
jgi:hypothetical protein